MKIVDTHQHLWDLKQLPYSWCAGIPKLNRSFLLSDYLEAAHGTGIEKTIFMECDVEDPNQLAEAQYIQKLAEANPIIAGMIVSGRPEHAGFPAHLELLLKLSKLRGLRRVLHVVPDEISQTPLFAENVRRLAQHQLPFDICMLARQLPLALKLIKQCPDVQFILDHCGVPEVKDKAFEPWRSHMKEIAALPNVACKVSGIVAYAAENWTAEDLRPWVEHVIESFGWDRVVWGGDWPVCTLGGSLSGWVRASKTILAAESPANQAKLFSGNAERIYRV
jgi:predicted TIM-barrel fold metal-dependent hydrolase